jgi:uncharacterized protein YjbI with pentapeptide repeats
MANPEHLAILKQGVEVWNRWRKEKPGIQPDLSSTPTGGWGEPSLLIVRESVSGWTSASIRGRPESLRGMDLKSFNFSQVDFSRTDLRGTSLSGADLSFANLDEANLTRANLRSTVFRRSWGASLQRQITIFQGTTLTRTILTEADLYAADLSKADLTKARFSETLIVDCNLAGARGLESCVHNGPSTIDYRTIVKSRPLPRSFLQGCGLTDELIEVLNHVKDFYSCFISYSTADQEFANHLYTDLQDKGVRCWFAPHNIQGGKKIPEQIDEAIRIYDRLLLILSDASMASEWVKTEIANARQRELLEKRQMLFPIGLVPYDRVKDWKAFDADTGKDSAREIREYFIPDFSNWKDHDSYQASFQRLLRDLKAEGR